MRHLRLTLFVGEEIDEPEYDSEEDKELDSAATVESILTSSVLEHSLSESQTLSDSQLDDPTSLGIKPLEGILEQFFSGIQASVQNCTFYLETEEGKVVTFSIDSLDLASEGSQKKVNWVTSKRVVKVRGLNLELSAPQVPPTPIFSLKEEVIIS